MARLHVYIDGTWLYKICEPRKVLSCKTIDSNAEFPLDFNKLNQMLLAYVRGQNNTCTELGSLYYITSIFDLPQDFDTWPARHNNITHDNIRITRRNVQARESFAQRALRAGYLPNVILRPAMRPHIIHKLINKKYQEKQVDTTLVALLVKNAITSPADFHVIIAGDADIFPAIQISFPEYTRNVIIATSHPDELNNAHRNTSYLLTSFNFQIPPFYFQERITGIIEGAHPYECNGCHKVFIAQQEIDRNRNMPYCASCRQQRQP